MLNKSKGQEKTSRITEIDEHIRRNFDILKRLGKGAYGIVWKAIDKRTTKTVAVKKIFDAFRNETDAQRTFREIMLLRALRNHPNIIQLYSIHRASNHLDIYLSFEFMESDLHNVIKRGSILKDIHKRYIMYQVFNATNFIHSGNIIHRDLKPSNILVDSKCRCKLADFGLARSLSQNHPTVDSNGNEEACLTDYVATRWYRAPEILIANKKYTKGIDMWSLGCILGEMCKGKPLFPGSCTINQIECILSALPVPSESDLKSVGNGFGSTLLNQPTKSINSSPSMDELLVDAPTDAKDLIRALLVMDPSKRLTAKQALCHQYVERFRDSTQEIELKGDIVPPFRDDIQLTVSEYRSKLYEIMSTTEKKKSLTLSPNVTTHLKSSSSPSSSTSSMKKTSISSNGRTILPKTITSQQQPGYDRKTVPTNVSYSSQKCQNDAKQHSSYSNVLQPKLISTSKQLPPPRPPPSSPPLPSTNMQHQQKQMNGSYGSLTNKLNCCKSCVRDADDALVQKCADDILLSKPKMTAKYHSIDLNSNYSYERDHQIKCKLPENHARKTTMISGAIRRNSIDVNGLFRNPSLMHSFDNGNDLHGRRASRQQSLDDCDIKASTHQPSFLKKLSPAQSEPPQNDDYHRNGNVTYLTQSVAKQHSTTTTATTNGDGRHRVIKQNSLDNYPDAPARLRNLDMKMRKHKVDVLKYHTNDHEKSSIYTDHKRMLSYPPTNQFRSKLDPFTRGGTFVNADCVYPKIGVDSLLQSKNSTFRKNSTNGGSYGIITSSELYKLRGTPERIT